MKLLSALVVDDSRSARYFLQRLLERNYCVVQTAESAEQAMERLTESAFDIVLLDYLLPGTNGFEVLDRIQRSRFRSRPAVIMCSSRQDREFIDQAILGGAAAILGKPADNEQLAQILADVRIKRAIPAAEAAAPAPAPATRSLLAPTLPAAPATATPRPYVPPPPPAAASPGLPPVFVSALESTLTPSGAREPVLPTSLSLAPYGGEARVSEQAPKVLPDLPDIEAMLMAPTATGSLTQDLPASADSAPAAIDFAAEIDWSDDDSTAPLLQPSADADAGEAVLATLAVAEQPEVDQAWPDITLLEDPQPDVAVSSVVEAAQPAAAASLPPVAPVAAPTAQASSQAMAAVVAQLGSDTLAADGVATELPQPTPPAPALVDQTGADSAVQAALYALQDEVRQLRQQVEQLPVAAAVPAPLAPTGPSLMDMRRLVHQMQDDLDKRFDQLLGSLSETQRLQRDADERLLASIERAPLAEQASIDHGQNTTAAYSDWAHTVQINNAVDRERRQSRIYRVGFGLLTALGAMLFTLVFTQLRTAPTAMIAGAVIMLMAIVAGLALIHRAAENRSSDGEPH